MVKTNNGKKGEITKHFVLNDFNNLTGGNNII